jgi:hypothetical protein
VFHKRHGEKNPFNVTVVATIPAKCKPLSNSKLTKGCGTVPMILIHDNPKVDGTMNASNIANLSGDIPVTAAVKSYINEPIFRFFCVVFVYYTIYIRKIKTRVMQLF